MIVRYSAYMYMCIIMLIAQSTTLVFVLSGYHITSSKGEF